MFAVLHLADFALQAVLRTEPAIGLRPAALFSGHVRKSLVISINSAARASGVELGMTAPQAVARCPPLVIRAPLPAAEKEARAALLAVGFTLSPLIEDTAPGVCTIDLKGADAEKLVAFAQAAVDELTRVGLTSTAGIASTPLLALYAARTAFRRPTDGDLTRDRPAAASAHAITKKSTSKNTLASPLKPAAVVHVTDPASFLSPLPLSAADPSMELSGVLASWGVRTLGDLTALPRDEIVRRFGAEGLALWQRAAGGSNRPLHPVVPPQTFSAEMEFEQEIETLEPLLFILRRFLERLALELQTAHSVAAELEFTLKLEDDTTHSLRLRLPEPTLDLEILFRALHTHLESLRTEKSIAAVQLRLTPTRPLVRQQGLFETGLLDPHGFAETMARVMALVGPDHVGTPELEDTHRPDAVKLVAPHAVIPPPANAPVHPLLGLPLRRFRPPLAARLEFTEGRATYLWTEQVHGDISVQQGPWPKSGHWWQNDRAWARLEWDIELAGGGVYRLLRVGEVYFLEGEYD
ncbi:MAG: DNA polymerase Y family protein [Opitutaceae bacterium]